jgi:hypothetical protein
MSRGLVRLIVAIMLLLAVYVLLSRLGFLPGLGGGSSLIGGGADGFGYKISRNAYGDRVRLGAKVKITYVPQKDAPDEIDITPRQGNFDGEFTWTLVPEQGGEHRLFGEYGLAGRAYKVCEYLLRSRVGAGERAERFQPINNDGPRYRMPEEIDPIPLRALYEGMIAEQSRLSGVPKGSTEEVSISPSLQTLANQDTYFCLGTKPPR